MSTGGARVAVKWESAQAKNEALKEAGAVVPTSYVAFEAAMKETSDKPVLENMKFLLCLIL